MDAPKIHCLVGKPIPARPWDVGMMRIVEIHHVPYFVEQGYFALLDPLDKLRYDQWKAEQDAPHE